MLLIISSCGQKIIYITPNIPDKLLEIPSQPKLYPEVPAFYDKTRNKIEYNIADAAKLNANILLLKKDSEALRIKLDGVRKALENFKKKAESK